MRVLLVHESYRQRGGEDAVFEAERDLLADHGHEVVEYRVHNDAVEAMGRLRLAATTVWSGKARRELRRVVRDARPDVAHFHNTLPLISPAAYGAVRGEGVPVVQTLHNYRMVCPSALLYRDGSRCGECVGKSFALPAIRHGCYRGSRPASAAVATMLAAHRWLGTWRRDVDVWIALTEFAKGKVAEGGVPEDKVAVVPNFLAQDPGLADAAPRDGLLFVGRLTEEKGVRSVLQALPHLPEGVPVRIAGDGPLRDEVAEAARHDGRVEFFGALDGDGVAMEMRRAAALVFPSVWFEGMPMTIIEAFATGLPVVASDLGAMASMVGSENGARFEPGDAAALARAAAPLLTDRAVRLERSAGARRAFETHHRAEAHLNSLLAVYEAAAESLRTGKPVDLAGVTAKPDCGQAPAPSEEPRTNSSTAR